MNYKSEIKYFEFLLGPRIDNPNLDNTKPYVEISISCRCLQKYRTFVNGETPIPDVPENVFCPSCGSSAKEFYSVAGHSAGWFNAVMFHTNLV